MHIGLLLAMAPVPAGQADPNSPIFMIAWVVMIALPIMLWKSRGRPLLMQVTGVVFMIVGLSLGLLARAHSPYMGLGEMMTKMNSYVLKEPVYQGFLIAAACFIFGGVFLFIKGYKAHNFSFANIFSGEKGSALNEIKKAKELLDSGAIDAAEFDKIKKSALDR